MQIKKTIPMGTPESLFDKELQEAILSAWFELSSLLNGGLKFSDNFNAEILEISDSGVADSEITVAHTLKRTPTGFIVTYINKAGVVYVSGTAWTATNIYLKCNVASCAIKVFVW
jgi:hypothetical protein